MDIVEEVNAIVDAITGNLVSSDVNGSIQCQSHLSGIPDLLLTFKEPELIDDCSFHPCVRYGRFERDHAVSFVPPDGNFQLMRYSISAERRANFSPPLECYSQWNVTTPDKKAINPEASARLMVQTRVRTLSSLIMSSSRKDLRTVIEDVAVTIPFPKQVRTATFEVSTGSIVYDEAGKVAKWTLGKIDDTVRAQLSATLKLQKDDQEGDTIRAPNLSLHWKIPLASVSGLTVSGLSLAGEAYRPYKGVRNVTKSGIYQVRYS